MDFRSLINEYLKVSAPIVSSSTINTYKIVYDKYVNNFLGNMDINDIKRKHILFILDYLKFNINEETNNPYSDFLIRKIMRCIKIPLSYALLQDYISLNPFYNINVPKCETKRRKELKVFSLEEQEKFENYIFDNLNKSPYLFLFAFSMYSGLRVGELCALRWDDINVINGVIKINKSYGYTYNERINKFEFHDHQPKTSCSFRTIVVPMYIIDYLDVYKKKTDKTHFASTKSKRINDRYLRRKFNEIVEKLEISKITLHGLRHDYATRCIESGMDVKTLSELLGHSKCSTTRNIYIHSTTKAKIEAMDKIGSMLNRAQDNTNNIKY